MGKKGCVQIGFDWFGRIFFYNILTSEQGELLGRIYVRKPSEPCERGFHRILCKPRRSKIQYSLPFVRRCRKVEYRERFS